MLIGDRVVVQIQGNRFIFVPADVIVARKLPPVVKRAVVRGCKYLIV